jgi:hypothetical protein
MVQRVPNGASAAMRLAETVSAFHCVWPLR